jgi:uncharacterized protein with von Willebrand factor type A (vWA) domain
MDKVKFFCLDVSGSMSNDDLNRALSVMADRAKPQDYVVLFDCEVVAFEKVEDAMRKIRKSPLSLHEAIASICTGPHKGRGGTDARECYQTVCEYQQSHQICDGVLILLSDGLMPQDQIAVFDEFVDITKSSPTPSAT